MQLSGRHALRQAGLRRTGCARPRFGRNPRCARVYASEGVQDLLARDRKQLIDNQIDKALEQFGDPEPQPSTSTSSSTEAAASSAPPASSSSKAGRRRAGPKSKQQRRKDMAQAADDGAAEEQQTGPSRCKEAIDEGLAKFAAKDYQAAIDLFNLALELPGNGAYRIAGSPREYSCPSDAEENAALYNMACCYAQLQQRPAALACLEAILENGFDDVATLRSDPDLAPIRGGEFEALLGKYTGVGGALGKLFAKKEKVIVSDANKNKPWILW